MVNTKLTKHLLKNNKLVELLGGRNIFYLEKPLELNPLHFIVIKDKLIRDEYIRDYKVEIDITSRDIKRICEIEEELATYLHDVKGQKAVEGFKLIKRLSGGGTINDEDGKWTRIVYFLIKM